ncbi:hypothetical protein BC938DRAFT_480799 [Jimgerdemannia flammicorona]|uniref:Tag1-like fifth Ig-like domain-containing protein n=1 Tax=Jimgerdemannia flammicorona TaxID=994334 RepID=A0A433QHS8_9FUNG|nr:hypothetical protein BC938DRAFT_480799 [Jimgerdemannia flammicorona]
MEEHSETSPLLTEASRNESSEPVRSFPKPWRTSSRVCFLAFLFFLLLGFTVALLAILAPQIVQHLLDTGAVDVLFEKAEITDVGPGGNEGTATSVGIHVTAGVKLSDKLSSIAGWMSQHVLGQAFIDPSDLEIFNDQEPYALGVITLPDLPLDLTQRESRFEFDTRFEIQNETALAEFCRDAVQMENVRWKIRGPVGMKPGWLPVVRMGLEKEVVLQDFDIHILSLLLLFRITGMNGLQDVRMESVSFPGEHPDGGISLEAEVMIYNPSNALSFTLGDVEFAIYLPLEDGQSLDHGGDMMIAIVQAKDVKLLGQQFNRLALTGRTVFGDNNPSVGELSRTTDTRREQVFDRFLSRYLKGQSSLVHVRGSPFDRDGDTNNSNTTPEWLRTALQSVTLSVPFPGSPTTDFVRSLSISNISIDFESESPLISGIALATIRTPDTMRFSINIIQIHPIVYVFLNASSPNPFAKLAPAEPSPALTTPDNDTVGQLFVESRIVKAPFTLLQGMDEDFEKFMNKTFYDTESRVTIRGTVDAAVESPLGKFTVRDLEFEGEIVTKGMQGLVHPPPNVTSITITSGTPDAISLLASFIIFNPSNVVLSLGTANFDLVYGGEVIGNTTINGFKLALGWNNVTSLGYFNPDAARDRHQIAAKMIGANLLARGAREGDEHAGNMDQMQKWDGKRAWRKGVEFLSKYISGEEITLTIDGNRTDSSSNPYLLPLLQQFTFTTKLPLFTDMLLVNSTMHILSSTIILWLRNPLPNTSVKILALNATAEYKGHLVAKIAVDFETDGNSWSGPVVLPPRNATEKMRDDKDDENDDPIDDTIPTPRLPVEYNIGSIGYEGIKRALGGSIEVDVISRCRMMVGEMHIEDIVYVRNGVVTRVRKGY